MANLYRIGEVSKVCEIPIKTLRYYEEEGLIKPVKVDIYTGYRYYSDYDIMKIYKVKLLKNLGFSLKEIRDYNEESLSKKIEDIEEQLAKLKDNKRLIAFLQKQKGEKIMKPFINDEKVIGKWVYVGSAESKEDCLCGKTQIDESEICQNLYFLPEGKGYWIFDRWTKGELYHFDGCVYSYELIEDNKLILTMRYNNGAEEFAVYEKQDSKEYAENEIEKKDDVNLPFIMDKNVLGFWQVVDLIKPSEKISYKPKKCEKELFLKAMTFNPNGEVLVETKENAIYKSHWTKGKIMTTITASDYIIREIDGETYLIKDWKSGDYVYQGVVTCCYVLKKV